jgi:cell wall-associated NlpC family hydrolase
MPESRAVRKRLQDITEALGTRYTMRDPPWPRWLVAQMTKHKLDSLKKLGLAVRPEPSHWRRLHRDPVSRGQLNINCFAYALGLCESRLYCDAARETARRRENRWYASAEFVKWLTEHLCNERRSARPGDVALYADQSGRPRHAGIVIERNRTRSKWGTFPAIIEHDIWKVPMNYGTSIGFVRPASLRKLEDAFVEYWTSH